MSNNYSEECIKVLKQLAKKKNVVLMGPPATGKSRIMNEIAQAFMDEELYTSVANPVHSPEAVVPIPRNTVGKVNESFPGNNRTVRNVFRTTFHQNTKYRDFISGIMPDITQPGAYKVNMGTLYRASEFAKQDKGASLLIIDEMNRGSAVEIFGGSLVAIEQDKRLDENNKETINTQKFELLNHSGNMEEYAFPKHLYILAAMNQADSSVAPLDVAFLRRWSSYKMKPNKSELYKKYGNNNEIKGKPENIEDIYNVAIRAWELINQRIEIGRGADYQIGQGIFFANILDKASTIETALQDILDIWPYIYSHIEECFWGDLRSIATVLNVDGINRNHIIHLEVKNFAEEQKYVLEIPEVNIRNIYEFYYEIIGEQ